MKDSLTVQTLLLVLIFSLWAVLHTALSMRKIKNAVLDNTGPFWHRWYRLLYILFASVTFIPVLILLWLYPGPIVYHITGWPAWLMRAGQILAAVGMTWAVLLTNPLTFAGLTEESRLKRDLSPIPMMVRGPFRWVRHPMYTFSMLAIWCQPKMTSGLLVLFCLMTLYFYLGSIHEEKLLELEFGEAYRTYRKKTGRFLPFKSLSGLGS